MSSSLTPEQFHEYAQSIEAEVGKIIVGQRPVVRDVLTVIIAGGHVLLEGVPGLGKTMLIRTLAQVLDLEFSRVQFTPDLMPADITGTEILGEYDGQRSFRFQPGPLFANLVLADEINRATPKTQSALLEAMQEGSVTVADQTHALEQPFFVMATQNPLEMEGTYPLPEAQLDRFLFKIDVPFPSTIELVEILERTTGGELPSLKAVVDGGTILAMRELSREVPVPTHVGEYIARLVVASHPDSPEAPELIQRYVRYGASPRGGQALVLGAKVTALMDGRFNVSFEDVHAVTHSALRHRLLLSFEALAEDITPDFLLAELLEKSSTWTEAQTP